MDRASKVKIQQRKVHPVHQQFLQILEKYESYPDRKAKIVQGKDYIATMFGSELIALQKRLETDTALATQLKQPMGQEQFGDLATLFRMKLLLRDTEYREFTEQPPMIRLLEIKEELVLPPGMEVNPLSRGGIYWVSEEDREIIDKARTLFVTADYKLQSGEIATLKLPLDLVMASSAYTEQCRVYFAEHIILPNIIATKKAYEKHKAELMRTFDQSVIDS